MFRELGEGADPSGDLNTASPFKGSELKETQMICHAQTSTANEIASKWSWREKVNIIAKYK